MVLSTCFQTWQDIRSKAKSKNLTLIQDEPPTPEVAIFNPPAEETLEPMENTTIEQGYIELDDTQVEFDFVDLDTLPANVASKFRGESCLQETSSSNIETTKVPLMEESAIGSQQTSSSAPTNRETSQRCEKSSKIESLIGNRSKCNGISDNTQFHNRVIELLTKHVECAQNYHDKNLTLLMKQVEFTQSYQMQKLAILTKLVETKEIAKSKK